MAEQLERDHLLKESSSPPLLQGTSLNREDHQINNRKNSCTQRVRPKVSFNCSVIQTEQLAMTLKQVEEEKKSNPLAYLKRRGNRKRPT